MKSQEIDPVLHRNILMRAEAAAQATGADGKFTISNMRRKYLGLPLDASLPVFTVLTP
jgi:hypothetical protein